VHNDVSFNANVTISNNLLVHNDVSFNANVEISGNLKVNDSIYGTNNKLELFTNTSDTDSYSFLEMQSTITTIGCPKFRILTNSSNAGIGAETFSILANGNVGIGTNNPSQKLDVNGTIKGSNLITNGYLDLNPDGGLTYNAQLRHDNFYPNAKPDQIKMFLRNHSFWSLLDGTDTGNGGDGTRKMTIDVPLEVNGHFYVNDILHQRYNTSSYQIIPNLGWSGSFNSAARLELNQYTASLRVLNTAGAEITSVSPYKDGNVYISGTMYVTGSVYSNTSDDRLKSYDTEVSNATETVMKLKPKFYKKHPTLITDDPTPDLSGVVNFDEYGFIAQELNEDPVLSHFASLNPQTEIYHVNYIEMIPLLVQTIKELNNKVQSLENENILMKNTLNELLSEAGKSNI
jgi:hypothetical protein